MFRVRVCCAWCLLPCCWRHRVSCCSCNGTDEVRGGVLRCRSVFLSCCHTLFFDHEAAWADYIHIVQLHLSWCRVLSHAIPCILLRLPDPPWCCDADCLPLVHWVGYPQTLISKRAGLYRSKNELRAANSRLVKGLQVMDKRLNPQNTKVRGLGTRVIYSSTTRILTRMRRTGVAMQS